MTEPADSTNGHSDAALDAGQPALADPAETSLDEGDMNVDGFASDAFSSDGADEDLAGDGADEMSADALDESEQFEEVAELAGDEGLDEGDLLDDTFDQAGDGVTDLMEATVADALDAEDSDEFFRALLGGIGRVARGVGRGAGAAGRVAGQARRAAGRVQRVAQQAGGFARRAQRLAASAGRVAAGVGQVTGRAAGARSPARSLLQQLLPLLQQFAADGTSEATAFVELSDLFSEEGVDEALPVLAGIAARRLAAPLLRRAVGVIPRPLARQLVHSATRAAHTLVRSQGRRAVRALPRLASGVARRAVQRRASPRALPRAMTTAAARVARRPAVVRRLAGAPAPGGGMAAPADGSAVGVRPGARRFRLRGPVEIVIYQR